MQDEVEVKARDWSGMDGATAWHLIDRHANNWSDVGEMMNAWLASNSAAALRQRPVVDDASMARALDWLRNVVALGFPVTSPEHLPAIEEAIAAYDPNCGGRTVRVVDDAQELPPLPEAALLTILGSDAYTARQMQEYARAALLAAYQQDNGGQQG